jgi:hypothetical protein
MPFTQPGLDDQFSAFQGVFAFVAVLVVLGIIGGVVASIVRAKRVVDAGHNPLTLETDIALKVLDSQALAREGSAPEGSAPEGSVGRRLAELDALQANGAITAAEYAAARERILGTL